MGDPEQVTAASPGKDADMKDAEQEQKRGMTDYSKLEEQIAKHEASAKQVLDRRKQHAMCAVCP
jgi:hypothetical protein